MLYIYIHVIYIYIYMYIICTKMNIPEQMFRVNRETTADMAPFQTAPEIDQSEHHKKTE